MEIEKLISEKLRFLRQCGIDSSRQEVRMLLEAALGDDRGGSYFHQKPLTGEQEKLFDRFIAQRAAHWPVDKIIGRKGFYKYEFVVNRDVLSPRPETEILVEEGLNICRQNKYTRILEFGTGSGCILISLLAELPQAEGVGVDISESALEIARKNARDIGVDKRIRFIQTSWFAENIVDELGSGFDVVVSNPPYIPSGEIAALDEEVKSFDPLMALDGGADGLRDYRRITGLAAQILAPGGWLLFEAGAGQAADIVAIGEANGFSRQAVVRDLSGIERCIILKNSLHFAKV